MYFFIERNVSFKMANFCNENYLKLFINCMFLTILIQHLSLVFSNPITIINNNENKWKPIKNYKSILDSKTSTITNQQDFMNLSESRARVSSISNGDDKLSIKDQQHQIMPEGCARMFREQILEALASQAQAQFQQQSSLSQNQPTELLTRPSTMKKDILLSSFPSTPSIKSQTNTENLNVIRRSRALLENLIDNSEEDESYEEDGIGNEQTDSIDNNNKNRKELVSNNSNDYTNSNNNYNKDLLNDSHNVDQLKHRFTIDSNQAELEKDSSTTGPEEQQQSNDEASLRGEQEANESSEAEAADKSALDEQQQQQREIILAQAEHEAKAIKEQHELLLKQQKLQQQMVFMRDRNDLNSNNSDFNLVGSTVDRKKLHNYKENFSRKPRPAPANQADIQFSDQPYFESDKVSDLKNNSNEQYEMIQEENKPKLSSSDLISSAQHNYGAHYGGITHHQSHYYQFAESHKKGQYDSGFKRGNKKFKISGHSSQHKSHAEGHVKWKAKKGKGTHYWDYKHNGKKHHYY